MIEDRVDDPHERTASPEPKRCPECGGALEKRRLPLSLEEVYALGGILALGAAVLLRARESYALPPLAIGFGVVLLPLFGCWVATHFHRRTPRCISCGVVWTRENFLVHYPVNPMAVLGAMLILLVWATAFAYFGEWIPAWLPVAFVNIIILAVSFHVTRREEVMT